MGVLCIENTYTNRCCGCCSVTEIFSENTFYNCTFSAGEITTLKSGAGEKVEQLGALAALAEIWVHLPALILWLTTDFSFR